MDIQVLTIQGYSHEDALTAFARALALEGYDPELIKVHRVTTEGEALALRFHGSPTFALNGMDLFPSDNTPALTFRVSGAMKGFSAVPCLDVLQAHLHAGLESAEQYS
ncbi:hypothetical protein FHU41_002139 [Psychromicrobium silvestre]|uniref:Uncharacterized protein n=1 Tax=Psychromicrobium silvestre TaxID=1645614 RepID=A0A7Y9LUK3_9MICC|nr:hypothetical protein [Psychromicrobium silvestre]NYE95889.1 hypothetical protein [Psychromicrobium silvestre]